jgi:inorganic pyrophosphatase
MIVHPWHGIDPGDGTPETVDCIIEIPRGSHQKYEMDKKTGLLRLDRVLYSAVFYPANYGFIPRTYCDDRDPLDILVLGQEPVVPMCILTARPIGVMQMWDQDEEDDKIIAVHEHDPAFRHYRDISELPQHTCMNCSSFSKITKSLNTRKCASNAARAATTRTPSSLPAYAFTPIHSMRKATSAPTRRSGQRSDAKQGRALAFTPHARRKRSPCRRAPASPRRRKRLFQNH